MDDMDTYRKKIEQAENAILDAYWSACDEKRGAVPPHQLTDSSEIEDYLADAYDIALRREDLIKSNLTDTWEETKGYV